MNAGMIMICIIFVVAWPIIVSVIISAIPKKPTEGQLRIKDGQLQRYIYRFNPLIPYASGHWECVDNWLKDKSGINVEGLQRQINCIADGGHKFVFKSKSYSPIGNQIISGCSKCGVLQYKLESQLTKAERAAIKTLGL